MKATPLRTMTGTYYPNDCTIMDLSYIGWSIGDRTVDRNRAAPLEGPSYCVRLLVFDYNDCL